MCSKCFFYILNDSGPKSAKLTKFGPNFDLCAPNKGPNSSKGYVRVPIISKMLS